MDNYIITLLIQKKEDNCKNINEVKLEVMDALHEECTYEPLDVYATTQIEKAYVAGRSLMEGKREHIFKLITAL